jgi:hypothetical protein
MFMPINLILIGCLGVVAGQSGGFESYLREHKAFGKAVVHNVPLW